MQKPETLFRHKVDRLLKTIPNSWWESIQQRAIKGSPDKIGCVNGLFVALELKTAKGKLSELQAHKMELIKVAGGIAVCLRPDNLDETIQYLIRLATEM